MRVLALLALLFAIGAYGYALGHGAQAPRPDVWSALAAEAEAYARAMTKEPR